MICKNCNNKVSEGEKFCGKCGKEIVAEEKNINNQKLEKKSPLIGIVSFIVLILAIGTGRYLTQGDFLLSKNQSIQSDSTVELVRKTVKEVKDSMVLPNQIDDVTRLVDITAELSAIRYHYILTGIDESNLSNDYLKNYLTSGVCENKDTKNLLNRGINMEYSYLVEDTTSNYFVSITKEDCL
ncbi:MAG: zinc-ribbon domain-containing protein [Candidatus Paceibacterota bacterium]|jgi:hypothetical protein